MKKLLVSPWVLWGLILALAVGLITAIVKSVPTVESPKGFVLPEGDAALGQQAFIDLGCVKCHTVSGINFGDVQIDERNINVPLGGAVTVTKTYGRLVTDIIHPSEAIRGAKSDYVDAEGRSIMPDYRKDMTVEQLTNLVRFLSDHYETIAPGYNNYYYHGYDYYYPVVEP